MTTPDYKIRATTELIVIHSAFTYFDQDIGVDEIRKWHMAYPRKWIDVGYHFVIPFDGSIQVGRPLNAIGAHVKGVNHKSVGICLTGGKDRRDNSAVYNFSTRQMQALQTLVTFLSVTYPKAVICGHRDLDGRKECPSFDAKLWAKENIYLPSTITKI